MAALAHGGAAVYQLVPFHVLELQQEKDDVQTSLQFFFFVWQPNLCKKQVLSMAVACAQAWGHLQMCT